MSPRSLAPSPSSPAGLPIGEQPPGSSPLALRFSNLQGSFKLFLGGPSSLLPPGWVYPATTGALTHGLWVNRSFLLLSSPLPTTLAPHCLFQAKKEISSEDMPKAGHLQSLWKAAPGPTAWPPSVS